MDYGVVVQARQNSTRCPGKVSKLIAGNSMLYHQLNRIKQNLSIEVILATTDKPEDDVIEEIGLNCDVEVFRGSENNVLQRYVRAGEKYDIDNIVRVTGDDPLIDPKCIEALVNCHRENAHNYITTHHNNGWIYGTSAELFEIGSLKNAIIETNNISDLEHVSPYIKRSENYSKHKLNYTQLEEVRPDIFLTVDYPEDFEVVRQIIEYFHSKEMLYHFSQKDLIELYDSGKILIKNTKLHSGFE